MDESDYVCPLCCEEVDISDREFYPCKCGYQVCMWCWHRIRETESGLCPACRTPYGEDPHQFTAVDVQEVLRLNKEREATAKKREKTRQTTNVINAASTMTGSSNANMMMNDNSVGSNTAGGHHSTTATTTAAAPPPPPAPVTPFTGHHTQPPVISLTDPPPMEVPKDRRELSSMRVIRRNLVYAVGLPPSVANEDLLRRPDYFGQYGKIIKIVLNRSQLTSSEPRGRATASAYVTFAHKEDALACILVLDGVGLEGRIIRASFGTSKYCSTFIKNVRCSNPECTYLHEMGAAEDTFSHAEIQAGYVTSGRDVLARQNEIVAEQMRSSSGGGGSGSGVRTVPRKRTGGGGPSGTGKHSANPVFPPPEYEEALRPHSALVLPPPTGISRATSAVASAVTSPSPPPPPGKIGRSATVNVPAAGSAGHSPPISSAAAVAHNGRRMSASIGGTTAASVVAGTARVPKAEPTSDPHATLTPLTPLKRVSKTTKASTSSIGSNESNPLDQATAATLRNGKKKSGRGLNNAAVAGIGSKAVDKKEDAAATSIGGDVIGPPATSRTTTTTVTGALPEDPGPDKLGGALFTMDLGSRSTSSGGLGGDVYNGTLPAQSSFNSNDRWNSAGSGARSESGGNIWSQNQGASNVGGPSGSEGLASSGGQNHSGDSSSALASLLGISLPTGSDSLYQSSSLWSSSPARAPIGPSALSTLNGTPVHERSGNLRFSSCNDLIGGVPIGGRSAPARAPIGGGAGGGNKSEIALLQSLLPGVHITSGSAPSGFGSSALGGVFGAPGVAGHGSPQLNGDHAHWGNSDAMSGQQGGQNQQQQQQQASRHGSLW